MLLNDSVGRSEYYKRMIESGVLTPNEGETERGACIGGWWRLGFHQLQCSSASFK